MDQPHAEALSRRTGQEPGRRPAMHALLMAAALPGSCPIRSIGDQAYMCLLPAERSAPGPAMLAVVMRSKPERNADRLKVS